MARALESHWFDYNSVNNNKRIQMDQYLQRWQDMKPLDISKSPIFTFTLESIIRLYRDTRSTFLKYEYQLVSWREKELLNNKI